MWGVGRCLRGAGRCVRADCKQNRQIIITITKQATWYIIRKHEA